MIKKCLFALVLSFMMPVALSAGDHKIGEEEINITAPTGYTELTEDHANLTKYFKAIKPANSRSLASFISEADMAQYDKGGEPLLRKHFQAATLSGYEDKECYQFRFDTIKDGVKESLNKKSLSEMDIDEIVSEKLKRVSDAASDESGGDFAMELVDVTFLGIDEEADNYISHSGISKIKIDNLSTGTSKTVLYAAASGMVLIKGKIILVNANSKYESKANLEWTRQALSSWIKDIIKINSIKKEEPFFYPERMKEIYKILIMLTVFFIIGIIILLAIRRL